MQKRRTYQVGPSTLSLEFGEITTSTAAVLVSSDDSYLTMGGGVSAAIRRAAGQGILLEVAKKIPAKLGDVVVTGAGSLPANDRMIGAGTEWEASIDSRLDESRVILLLISADFINSPYCRDVEMKRALERHEERSALVVPIIIRAVRFKGNTIRQASGITTRR
jgi:hypothetical protein